MKEEDYRTKRAIIKRHLRLLWLHSKERSQALKNTHYCCNRCGVKKSQAKGKEQNIEVHHKEGICNWDDIIDIIQEQLLPDPIKLEALCPDCHDKITYGEEGQ